MYVLSEEEYNRLKLQQKMPTIAAVEEPRTADVVQTPLPPTTHYTCPICGKTYKQKRDLRRHVKLAHGIAPPIKAIIPQPTPTVETNIIEKKNKEKKQKKRKNLKSKRLEVFDKVKKWMTIRD